MKKALIIVIYFLLIMIFNCIKEKTKVDKTIRYGISEECEQKIAVYLKKNYDKEYYIQLLMNSKNMDTTFLVYRLKNNEVENNEIVMIVKLDRKCNILKCSETPYVQASKMWRYRSDSLNFPRTKPSILKTIFNNHAPLQNDYKKRLKVKPHLKGRIVVKISILETGEVLSCEVVSATLADKKLQKNVVKRILKWDFGKIDVPNDTTFFVYPFEFNK